MRDEPARDAGRSAVPPADAEYVAAKPAGERWCFRCRKRLPHDDVLMVCDDPYSYYEPHWRRECSRCKGDHTAFPGVVLDA